MKIGILVAMDKELSFLIPEIKHKKEIKLDIYTAYLGYMADKEVCVMKCGIGKVNSALSADAMIREFNPDIVINTGVAGGADESSRILDLFIATSVAYHDVWCGPGTLWGQAAGYEQFFTPSDKVIDIAKTISGTSPRVTTGLICSGDFFISKAEEIKRIKEIFPSCLAVDMESASIAQTCTNRGVPFAIIRAISDTPGQGDNIDQYENFWTDAPSETFNTLTYIIKSLN